MPSFQFCKKKLSEMDIRKNTVPDRIRNLIVSGKLLDKPMTTKEMEVVLQSTMARKIPSIIPYMRRFLDNGIVGKQQTPDGKQLIWYGLWEKVNPIQRSEESFKSIAPLF